MIYSPSREVLGKVRLLFEPRYGRKLKESEVLEIALNLGDFAEIAIEAALRKHHKKPRSLDRNQ